MVAHHHCHLEPPVVLKSREAFTWYSTTSMQHTSKPSSITTITPLLHAKTVPVSERDKIRLDGHVVYNVASERHFGCVREILVRQDSHHVVGVLLQRVHAGSIVKPYRFAQVVEDSEIDFVHLSVGLQLFLKQHSLNSLSRIYIAVFIQCITVMKRVANHQKLEWLVKNVSESTDWVGRLFTAMVICSSTTHRCQTAALFGASFLKSSTQISLFPTLSGRL
jgi:hypothetical protein